MNYFISAIGTDSGKTIVSAIVTEALKADYWKPIQAGIEETDRNTVSQLISNPDTTIHPEQWLLKSPMSPHLAAAIDQIPINIKELTLPSTRNDLVIEGAGGLLVPVNDKDTVLDVFQQFEGELILVSNIYLGSINHTLLSINELKRRNINVKGIIFNGDDPNNTKDIILQQSGYKELLHVPTIEKIDRAAIVIQAAKLKTNW